MSTSVGKGNECVNVVVRCRPMLDKETKAGHERVVDMDTNDGLVVIQNPSKPNETPREFTFDFVYDWNSKQADLYEKTFQPLVSSVLEGYNGTIFAYGQTGTGKTYTMEGVRSDPNQRGVIPNSFEHIFAHINESKDQQYLVRASYLEIYQDEIRDLLSKDHKRRLDLKERPDTGVYVKDLSSFIAKSVKEIEHVMIIGNQNRAVGPTDMNEHSSRSHAIFIVTVECSELGVDGNDHIRVGKLNLVDLAGSERQSKTQATGDRFKEATKINLSLSALGNVISALVNSKSTHIPYRDSKLTYLLQDSLGGNSKTVMVANIGPASYNYEESLVTLRYANRAKNIKNKPRINEDPKDALLREYQDEIKRLKEALEVRKKGKKHSGSSKKKKRRNGGTKDNNDNMEQDLCSAGSSEGDDGSEGEDGSEEGERNEEMLKRLQDDLEKERKSVQENTEMLEEEKQVLLAKIHKKFEEVKSERKKLAQLASKIKAMESKLLSGAGIIRIAEDQRDMRKRDIQQKRDEMIEMKKRAQHIQKELEERAETNVEVQGSYQSLHEETSSKEKKLKKLQKKLKSVEAELGDCKADQYQMREELNEQLLVLEKEMKLRSLIIEHFIPESEVSHIKSMLVYNQDKQTWSSKGQNKDTIVDETDDGTPAVVSPHPLITEEFITKHNIILRLDLDMPTRITCDYEEPQVTPTVQAVIDKAIEDPEDMIIDASLFSERRSSSNKSGYVKHSDIPSQQFRLKEKAMKTQTTDPTQQFPVKRGLVKTK